MKKILREIMLEKRKSINKKEYIEKSYIISEKIAKLLNFTFFNSIAMYYPFRNEVDILNLIDIFYEKDILFPKICGKNMYFVKINSIMDFKKGKFGIMEPIGEEFKSDIDVFLIPGVAFDEKLYRLGYGGGYYDRYFSKHKKSFLIGVGFDFQILKELPIFDHDIKMDIIITEKRILKGD
ncbi:5-formyltetrahydrofolate cyclo-ligase [Marinitoga arctica]